MFTTRLWWLAFVIFQVATGAWSQSLSLTLDSSTDVTSGHEVCPDFTPDIEFLCVGTEVSYLEWQRNGAEIQPNFHIGDSAPIKQTIGPFTVSLEANDVDHTGRAANMTTRLVVNSSSLMSGDEIVCVTLGMKSSMELNYTLRGPPPAPALDTDVLISLRENNATFSAFDISWNPSFTAAHAINSYVVTPLTTTKGENLTVDCLSPCSSNSSCQCTGSGLAVGERVVVNVSAVNCATQEGAAVTVTIATFCLPDDLGDTLNSETDLRCMSLSPTSFDGSVSINNGVGCFNTAVGSVATYICDEGYSVGGLKRTCLINGSWNGTSPRCEGVSRLSPSLIIAVICISVVVIVVVVSAISIIISIFAWKAKKRKGTLMMHVTKGDDGEEPENQCRGVIQI